MQLLLMAMHKQKEYYSINYNNDGGQKMENISYVDLSEKLNPILSKKRTTYNKECHRLCNEEASKVWQIPCNEYGVILDGLEVIEYGTKYNCKAEIILIEGGNKLWMYAVSVMLPNQGFGSLPSIFSTRGYKNRYDVIKMGIAELAYFFKNVIKRDGYKSDKEASKKLLIELANSQQEQINLF